MRTITVSTEVFAEIWRRHKKGDQSEDDILRRELDVPPPPKSKAGEAGLPSSPPQLRGYDDVRAGVKFPEGFPIFRIYKGQEIQAVATGGQWLMTRTGTRYASLHKLSMAVVKGQENSWRNWKYRETDGTERLIDALRGRAKKEGDTK